MTTADDTLPAPAETGGPADTGEPALERSIPSVAPQGGARWRNTVLGLVLVLGVPGVLAYRWYAGVVIPTTAEMDTPTEPYQPSRTTLEQQPPAQPGTGDGATDGAADATAQPNSLSDAMQESLQALFVEKALADASQKAEQRRQRRLAPTTVYSAGTAADTPARPAPTTSDPWHLPAGVAGPEETRPPDLDRLNDRLITEPPVPVTATLWRSRASILGQGKTLACTLETAIQSDLPGMTRCLVGENTYSDDGSTLLIPRGSMVIGEYRGGLQRGVDRVFVIWTRLRTPQGLDIALGSPGVGPLGRAGLGATIDQHYAERFGAAALLSIIGGLTATGSDTSGDPYAASANAFSRTGEIALRNSVAIGPTAHVAPGTPIIIMVARDVDFAPAHARLAAGRPSR